jgi:hypothetical protein
MNIPSYSKDAVTNVTTLYQIVSYFLKFVKKNKPLGLFLLHRFHDGADL